jgi:hypothetical protein
LPLRIYFCLERRWGLWVAVLASGFAAGLGIGWSVQAFHRAWVMGFLSSSPRSVHFTFSLIALGELQSDGFQVFFFPLEVSVH